MCKCNGAVRIGKCFLIPYTHTHRSHTHNHNTHNYIYTLTHTLHVSFHFLRFTFIPFWLPMRAFFVRHFFFFVFFCICFCCCLALFLLLWNRAEHEARVFLPRCVEWFLSPVIRCVCVFFCFAPHWQMLSSQFWEHPLQRGGGGSGDGRIVELKRMWLGGV